MTYFELFGIPLQLKVDTASLSKTFFVLSKRYHPDYFVNASESDQGDALENSALLNQAWKTFRDPDDTIKYVLQLKGLLVEEEKYELPPDFLMEVLELNEELMEIEVSPAPGKTTAVDLNERVSALQSDIYTPVQKIIEEYTDAESSEEDLLKVKEYYFKKKYLDRIRKQLMGMQ